MQDGQQLEALYQYSDADVRGRGMGAEEAGQIYGDYARFVSGFAPATADLLDVGCGNGWSAEVFSRLGHRVTGMDLNAAFFEPPVSGSLTLKEGSALDLPFTENSFDVVGTNQVLEHVSDPQRALAEMLRVLRPGGVLCVVSPNLISPLIPLRTLFRHAWRNRPLQQIFLQGTGMPHHPSGNTVPEALVGVLANTVRIAKQSFSKQALFEMRQPDMQPPFSADNDACYWCNPLDLIRFFQAHSCEVLCNGKPGRARWAAPLATGTCITVRKATAN